MFIYNLKINKNNLFRIIITSFIIISLVILSFSIIIILHTSKTESIYNSKNITQLNDKTYTDVLNSVHNDLNSYIGKEIIFTGYVYRIYDFNDNQFVLARDMIVSSDMQTVVVGFLCESKEIKNYNNGDWVEITGKIKKGNYHGEIPIIEITSIVPSQKPDNPYVLPPNDNYLQTPEI